MDLKANITVHLSHQKLPIHSWQRNQMHREVCCGHYFSSLTVAARKMTHQLGCEVSLLVKIVRSCFIDNKEGTCWRAAVQSTQSSHWLSCGCQCCMVCSFLFFFGLSLLFLLFLLLFSPFPLLISLSHSSCHSAAIFTVRLSTLTSHNSIWSRPYVRRTFFFFFFALLSSSQEGWLLWRS